MSKIEEVVHSEKRKRHFVECTLLGGVVCPLIRLEHYDTWLFSCGMETSAVISFLKDNGVTTHGIIIEKGNTSEYQEKYGYTCIKEEDLKAMDTSNFFVIITTEDFYGVGQIKILQSLILGGCDKIFAIPKEERYGVFGTRISFSDYFKKNIVKLEYTFNMLADEKSQDVMLEYIRAITEYDIYRLPQEHGKNKYFYEGDRIDERKTIYKHLDNEVWVNCGANVGDSIFLYFDNGLSAKRIYAYEGDPICYHTLCESLKLLPNSKRDSVVPINEYIAKGTNFGNYITEKVTLVNADIQGNELAMLEAMSDLIVKDRPVLAICVYHLKNDLIDIPGFISGIVSDYSYVLRKYAASGTDNPTYTPELVLYAIPNER